MSLFPSALRASASVFCSAVGAAFGAVAAGVAGVEDEAAAAAGVVDEAALEDAPALVLR